MDDQLLGLIGMIYDAVMDASLWVRVLQSLSDATHSQAASFWVLDGTGQVSLPTFDYINLDARMIQEYLDFMAPQDPTVQFLFAHANAGIVHDAMVITEQEKDRHPYYAWQSDYTDMRFRMVATVSLSPTVQAGVALHRCHAAGRYEAADLERFGVLYKHIQRALNIGFRMGTLGAKQQVTTNLLDRHANAIVVLDGKNQVLYANRKAETLCAQQDGLALSKHGLSLPRAGDALKLHGLLEQAGGRDGPSLGGAMQVERPSGKRPFGLMVAPAPAHDSPLSLWQPATCIVINDPEESPQPQAERLRAAYGLTPAESRLASLLATGESLRATAEQLHISYGTARTRLASIFRKTNTRRQGELVRLLLMSEP